MRRFYLLIVGMGASKRKSKGGPKSGPSKRASNVAAVSSVPYAAHASSVSVRGLNMPVRDKELSITVRVRERAIGMLGRIGGVIKSLGATLLRATKWAALLGATIAGVAIKLGKDFGFSIRSVGVVAGATAEQMRQLEDTARGIGATTAFSATQAADAMYSLASAGLDTTQIMGAAEHAVKLAGATAGDMSQATRIMAASMRAFNIDASESQRVSDVFSKAISRSMFSLESLTEAMKFSGTTGASLGWSLEETTAAVAQFANLGLEGSMAGTNLRRSMVALASSSDELEKKLNAIGTTWDKVNPATNTFAEIIGELATTSLDTASAIDIFGQIAGANMANVVNQAKTGQVDIEAFTKSLVDSMGTASDMYAQMMDTVEGQWQIFKSALQELFLTINDSFKVSIKEMLVIGTSIVIDLTKLFGKLAPFIAGVAAFIVAFGKVAVEEFHALANAAETDIDRTIEKTHTLNAALETAAIAIANIVDVAISALRLIIFVPIDTIVGVASGALSGVVDIVRFFFQELGLLIDRAADFVPHLAPFAEGFLGIADSAETARVALSNFSAAQFADIGEEIDALVARSGKWGKEVEGMFAKVDWGPVVMAVQDAANLAAADAEALVERIMGRVAAQIVTEGVVPDIAPNEEALTKAQSAFERLSSMANTAYLNTLEPIARLGAEFSQKLVEFDALAKIAMAQNLLTQEQYLMLRNQLQADYDMQLAEMQRQNVAERLGLDQEMYNMMTQSANMFITQTASAFGQMMGGLIMGQKQGGKEMVKALGAMLGQLAVMWGGYFITKGIAKVAEGIAEYNPLMVAAGKKMIVGGAALVALGAMLGGLGKGAGAARAAGGGGGGGGIAGAPRGGAGDVGPPRRETFIAISGVARDPNQEITFTGEQLYDLIDAVNEGIGDGNVIIDVNALET